MDNRYFTLINATMGEILEAVEEAIISYGKMPISYAEVLKIDLYDVHNNPSVIKYHLWTPANSKGVACFTNIRDGLPSLIYRIRKKHNFEVVQVCLSVDLPNCDFRYAMRVFHHWAQDGNERYVRVMQDPKWDFWEQGERLPFEQVDKYSERFIKNRLTNDAILDYLMELGWNLRSEDFWATDETAYCFEWKQW